MRTLFHIRSFLFSSLFLIFVSINHSVDMDFSTVLKKIRGGAFSERDKGDKFERLIANWLLTDPRYASKFSKVWMWADFPARADLGGNDTGIDLVARTIEGDYWAIQCKCYEKGTVITKAMVDTFISTSGRQFPDVDTLQTTHFACCLWVSTSDVFGRNASESTSGQSIPFCRIGFGDLANSAVDWQKLWDGLNGAQAALPCKQPMEHQTIAVNKAMDYFASHDRGKLIMACGTGKTYTALKIAETMTGGNGLVLFMVPSIALLGQSLNAWCADASEHIAAVCVCSDHTANRRARNGADAADTDERTFDLAYPASTDADNIARQLIRIKDEDGLKVVFSTYQSVMAVSKAQQEVLRLTSNQFGVFSLIVCDEAHRTTGIRLAGGSDESEFTKIHSNDVVRADKRLYMTATPRLYKSAAVVKAKENDCVLCSMDDASIYGEEFFRVNFSYAVQHNLLTDYKVLVLTVSESDIPQEVKSLVEDVDRKEINADETAKFVGVINGLSKLLKGDDGRTVAADPGLMRRAVAFCQKIGADDVPNSSKNMASVLPLISEKYNQNVPADRRQQLVSVQTRHVDGSMDASQRDELLYWLKEDSADPAECRVLCNVRCLSEGVDVPALDAVLFMSPRNSQVDVVQSVGRVMRNFRRGQEGEKKYGYIIIPIVIPDRVTPEEALNDNERFKVVWDILNALRSHDDNFNAEVNSIELNRNKASKVTVTRPGYNPYDNDAAPDQLGEDVPQYVSHAQVSRQLDIRFGKWQECIYAKLVEKVGDRFYWENWAREVGLIARKLIDRITSAVERKADHKAEFDKYLKCLQDDINPSVDAAQAIEMLAQHIITRPVFDALFADYQFVENNSVSSSMQRMIELLDADAIGKDTEELARFYDSVRTNVGHIDNLAGKQTVIKNLYEKFFKGAFPLTTAKLGIVYTPVECVDFIIHSVDDVLRQEFGSCLSNENVHIIDPFVGTGTFVTRLLQSGLIRPEDMERKYLHEIHCNEIVLLAYYIADVNIESVYHELMHPQHYLPYDGICLTDTFQTAENREPVFDEQWFGQNTAALQQQRKLPIKVIIANPPYSIGQKSANDNAQNQTYAVLDQRITDTYVASCLSLPLTKSALHDSYIKAFRLASDKIAKNEDGGVIGFITNSGWLEGNSTDGFRKCLEEEFSAIYVLNLRGNGHTSGERCRREGEPLFAAHGGKGGALCGVAITILVKKPGHKGKAVIHYHDIGDYLKREQKLDLLRQFVGVGSGKIDWQLIHPDKNGDWISHRNSAFDSLIPLNPDKKFDIKAQSVFNTYVIGVATNRDAWSYNFSEKALSANMSSMIDFYNAQSAAYKEAVKDNPNLKVEDFIDTNPQKISWTRNLEKSCFKR
jgi:predicted helicase